MNQKKALQKRFHVSSKIKPNQMYISELQKSKRIISIKMVTHNLGKSRNIRVSPHNENNSDLSSLLYLHIEDTFLFPLYDLFHRQK